MQKKIINITKKECGRIITLLWITDLSEQYDDPTDLDMKRRLGISDFGSIGAYQNDEQEIASFTFENGTHVEIALCSGESNYWIDYQIKRPDGSWFDLEPGYDLNTVEYEDNGETYVIEYRIIDEKIA